MHISGCPHKASQFSHVDRNPEKGLQFLCTELLSPSQYPGTILFSRIDVVQKNVSPVMLQKQWQREKAISAVPSLFDIDKFAKVWC